MRFSPASLYGVLDHHLPSAATGLAVALSGGADSASLLAALAQPSMPRFRGLPLRALHVDHGLQPEAAALRGASEALCRRLAVPVTVLAVAVDTGGGASIEAAARDARYRGLEAELHDGECLLTAHHAEDQAETVLLQLLRGAGLAGLSAMPVCRSWASGWHLRPLLDVAQCDLLEFGRAAGVVAVSDPMNADRRFDRSYLRYEVWPRILARWPGAARTLSRSARHLADAHELLKDEAARDLARLRDGAGLSLCALRALTRPRQLNVLRHWISAQAVDPPPAARLREALRQVMAAQSDSLPVVAWGGHALRRYRSRVFLTAARIAGVGQREWAIAPGAALPLGEGLGWLRFSPRRGGLDAGRLPTRLCVRPRRGGETIKPHAQAHTQTLTHLCQATGVLPWMRDALPLIYAGNELVAVGDLWHDARWCVAPGAAGFACEWFDAPNLT